MDLARSLHILVMVDDRFLGSRPVLSLLVPPQALCLFGEGLEKFSVSILGTL